MKRIRWLALILLPVLIAAAPWQEWVIPAAYRLSVEIDPGTSSRLNTPVGVAVNFREIFVENRLPGRIDLDSIRVVAHDARTGRSRPYRGRWSDYTIPYQTTGNFSVEDAGWIWWRMQDASATQYHIYFDSLANGKWKGPTSRGLVGVGDVFHYNDGVPGPANVFPLHSTFWPLDWDGDGLPDLIGIAYRYYEFGEQLEQNLGNAVYFLKNIGSREAPLFAPPHRLKSADGSYLRADQLSQNMFPADWAQDGYIDFVGVAGDGTSLLLWKNTGERDENGLWVLKQPQPVLQLGASEFRRSLPSVARPPSSVFRGLKLVDWEGNGQLDLIAGLRSINIVQDVDPREGVIMYGPVLNFFELFQGIGRDSRGYPEFAEPVVIRESRGLPITAFGTFSGGPEYVDWDSDGDYDLLFWDLTPTPLEGGRLMLAENDGTRSQPLLLKPVPILEIPNSPIVVDWNGDGCFDLMAGGQFFLNVNPKSGGCGPGVHPRRPSGTRAPHPQSYPRFVPKGPAQQIHPPILSHFTLSVDWDGDGVLDLLGGHRSHLVFYRNKGTLLDPVFDRGVKLQAGGKPIYLPNWPDPETDRPVPWGPQGPNEPIYGWVNPSVADWDGDGDLDLFVTAQRWQVLYYENIGTRTNPQLAAPREVRCEGDPREFSWRSKVALGDLDGDGQVEIVVTSHQDNIFYMYKPKPVQNDPQVLELYRAAPLLLEDGSPLRGWDGPKNNNGDNHSLLVDWDGDGDLDLIVGSLYWVWYYENVGSKTEPRFRPHGKFKAGGEKIQTFIHAGSFDAADWNGDGRLDLVLGGEAPSDQPLGGFLHLFNRAWLENDLPKAKVTGLQKR